ncbi:MAG: hypothetical protein N3G22_04805, partial [Candidatus Micrarchaeota archaeon]|nr:hypothetical protein [Candidatus Micrarchaeota archaeon]
SEMCIRDRKTYTYSMGGASPTYMPGDKIVLGYPFVGEPQPQPRDFKTITVSLAYINCRPGTSCTSQYVVSGKVAGIVEKAG